MSQPLQEVIKYWDHISPIIKCPKNDLEFKQLALQLDELLDIVGNDESHRLMSLVDVLSHLISAYEAEKYQAPIVAATGINALKFLMQSHGLTQSDLSAIGSQGVVSEILSGKRLLNVRQIKWLANHFQVDPATFMGD